MDAFRNLSLGHWWTSSRLSVIDPFRVSVLSQTTWTKGVDWVSTMTWCSSPFLCGTIGIGFWKTESFRMFHICQKLSILRLRRKSFRSSCLRCILSWLQDVSGTHRQSRECSWDWPVPWHPGSRRQETRPLSIPNLPGPLSITKSRWMTRCLFWDSEEDMKFRNENSQIFWSHCSAHGQAPHLDWSDLPCDIGTDNSASARDNFSHEAINYPNHVNPNTSFPS